MTDLERHLATKRAAGRKILSVYLTAGYPSPVATVELAGAMALAGADLLEIGIPFSDPLADGPVIQAAHVAGIRAGVTTADVLSMAGRIRKNTPIPVILMLYANTLLNYGARNLARDAAGAGVAGMIVPDLPPEESSEYREAASAAGIATIFLVAPTTPEARLRRVVKSSTGFVYCVSSMGVTGARDRIAEGTADFLRRTRDAAGRLPLLAGFGVSSPETARALGSDCDGIIVGSAVVSRLGQGTAGDGCVPAVEFVASLRGALDQP